MRLIHIRMNFIDDWCLWLFTDNKIQSNEDGDPKCNDFFSFFLYLYWHLGSLGMGQQGFFYGIY